MRESKIITTFAIFNIALFAFLTAKIFYGNNFSYHNIIICLILIDFIYLEIFYNNKKFELKQKKETMFSTITHDLKTPTLAQIKAIDLLLNKTFGELNENQIEILSQIKNSCQYMKELIFQVLDTYLYDSGKIVLNREYFDVIELLNSILEEISNFYKEKNQNIIIKTNLKNRKIYSDKLQIKRAVTNLISNSIKYGNINSAIEISLEEENNYTIFKTKNISKYIPKKKLNVIFEKFQKDNSRFNNTGTGLGLYLTKGIIKAHKGEVFAESFLDGTCIFGFKIPQYAPKKIIKTETIEFK